MPAENQPATGVPVVNSAEVAKNISEIVTRNEDGFNRGNTKGSKGTGGFGSIIESDA
jgi:hypothetical protein